MITACRSGHRGGGTLLRSSGQAIPSPLLLRAQLDNGASQSCIDLQCASTLGLVPTATKTMVTPTKSGASQSFDTYDVSVTLVHPATNLFLPQVEVVGASMFLQGFEVLLGRDVLKALPVRSRRSCWHFFHWRFEATSGSARQGGVQGVVSSWNGVRKMKTSIWLAFVTVVLLIPTHQMTVLANDEPRFRAEAAEVSLPMHDKPAYVRDILNNSRMSDEQSLPR